MVHLGIGNFHRAHQAWYTARAPDSAGWGIAGFTSRRPDMAEQLGPQDGLYTLITRGATGDDLMLIGALAAVHPSTDHGAYLDYLRRSEVAVITITVTEVGYQSLLAYAGSTRGHGTIDEAIADPECRSWVEEFWSEAGQHLILGSDAAAAYTSALLERFGNRRVRHQLSQIAPDGSRKLPIRIFPDARAEPAAGRMPIGCATVIAAWVLHLRGHGAPVKDDAAAAAQAAAADPDLTSAVSGVLLTLDPDFPADPELVETICGRVNVLMSR